MRIPELRIFGYVATVVPLLFTLLWILSASIDGSWKFGVNSLSDMGISDNAVSAFLFNFGCIATGISGIMGMFVGFGLFEYGRRTLKVGGIIYIIGMLFLSLVGVFTLDNFNMHFIVATTFSVAGGIGIVVSSISDWKVSWYLYADVFLIATAVIFALTTQFEMWEPVATIASITWVFITGIKMLRNEERLFTDRPLIGGN